MFARISILTITISLLVACDQNHPESSDNLVLNSLFSIDSCRIALSGDDRIKNDKNIRHYQDAVTHAVQPLVNLEKLGWAYISLARRTYDDGYYHLALETSKCIDLRSTGHDAALMLRAHVSHQLHNFKLAEQLAQRLVEKRGFWFDYALLGDALMEQGQLDSAEQAYQTMMNQRPGPQAYSRAAHLRWLKGDLPGAIEMAKLTVETYGYGESDSASWAKTTLGRFLFLGGEIELSEKIIHQTLELNNSYAPALFMKGRILLAQGNFEQAIISISKAVELSPLAEYLWVLLEVLESANKPEQAMQIKSQFVQKAKISDPRTYSLYLANSAENDMLALELAMQEFKQRQDIFSHDAMAWSLYANNEIQQALIHLEKALSYKTHDARLYYHAAIIYLSAANLSTASKWFSLATANQHMLLPSERTDLKIKFAEFLSHNPSLESEDSVSRNTLSNKKET